MAKLIATDFAGLDRALGNREARTIGNNTTAERDGADIVVRLHGHSIAVLAADGHVRFSLAGYPTVTTRERVNQLLPTGRVFQSGGVQFLARSNGNEPIDSFGWHSVR